jgi:hypothetical protein
MDELKSELRALAAAGNFLDGGIEPSGRFNRHSNAPR